MVEPILSEYELPEVLVGRDEYTTISGRDLQHVFVRDPRVHFRHVRHVVPSRSKRVDDRTVNTFITYELQAAQVGSG